MQDKTTVNRLLWLGGGAIVLIVMGTLVFVLAYLKAWPGPPLPMFAPYGHAPTQMNGPLGAEGSTCSGPERYPCSPGTICSASGMDWGKKYGTCVKDPAGTKPTVPTQ
jgi:hypothetical protein